MKRTLLALSVAAAVSVGMTSTVSASVLTVETPKEASCRGYEWSAIENSEEYEELLKKLFEDCNVYYNDLFLKNCLSIFTCGIKLPECFKPEISEPETSEPETQAPETSQPETSEPETQAPETSQPETSEPETQAPETSQPETSEPETEETASPDVSVHPYVLRIVELVNEERTKAGLDSVTLDMTASDAALVRARETVQLFSHTRPDGRSCFTALTEQGIHYRTAGENIAYGQRSPEEVMEGWMNSSGHRANILNASFTHIGVGYYQVNGVNYWTQFFFQ